MKKGIISIIILLIIFTSCKKKNNRADHIFGKKNILYSSPYLTKDKSGDIILSWVEEDTASQKSQLYFSVSKDDGKTFSKEKLISSASDVNTHGENLPKIICNNDEWIAAYGTDNPNPQNAYAGLVYYTQSFDEGKTWQPAQPLVKDTASYDERYFDMALLQDNDIGICWMDNRGKTKPEGSTLYFAETMGHSGFQQERPLAYNLCPCCRTDIMTDANKNIHIAFRQIIDDSIRDMMHIISTDNGKIFSAPHRISADNWVVNACPHSGPAMVQNKYGLHFAWFTLGGGQGVFYCHSVDNGKTFSRRENVSDNIFAKHPQIAALPDGRLVITWDEFPPHNAKASDHIGVQLRSADGKIIRGFYTGDKNFNASFPVIQEINNEEILVAFTEQNNTAARIKCERMIVNK